jgi:hypothetical protein
MKFNAEAKFWDVRFSIPSIHRYKHGDEVHEYPTKKNVHVMVAATDSAKYPTATIHQINHRGGDCGIIVQPELIVRQEG